MTIDLKYEIGQQVVTELDGSYRFAKITGFEVACSGYTEYDRRVKYELSVREAMLTPDGREVPLEPRTTWQTEQRTSDLLAQLKTQREQHPDSKPDTLLWNMRAEENKKEYGPKPKE